MNIHEVYDLSSLLRKNITMVERVNLQKVEIIAVYFLCNPSKTKQRNASNTSQKELHRQY